jgi:dynein heavy chain
MHEVSALESLDFHVSCAGIDEMSAALDELMENIARKGYDCLDAGHRFLEGDQEAFQTRLKQIVDKIRRILDREFAQVWSQPTVNMRFLKRFERLNERLPGLATEKKASMILMAFNATLDKVKKEYNEKRHDPPLPRDMPPVAGISIIDYRCEDREKISELRGDIGAIRKVLIPSFKKP